MAVLGKWIEGLSPASSVSEAARRSLQARLAAVRHHLPLAARRAADDVEHVHRLRVATRRAVAALELYRDFVPPKKARRLRTLLKRIRRAAGAARDLDVMLTALEAEQDARWQPVINDIHERRLCVQPDIVQVLAEARRKDKLKKLAKRVTDAVRPRRRRDQRRRRRRFANWAKKQLRRASERCFQADPGATDDFETLHRFRIEAKRLRYTLELLAPALGKDFIRDVYPQVEQLQERLGAVNDHVAAVATWRQWMCEADDDTRRQLLSELIEQRQQDLQQTMAEYTAWWSERQAANLQGVLRPKGR